MKAIGIVFILSVFLLFSQCGQPEHVQVQPPATARNLKAVLKPLRTFLLDEHTYKIGRPRGAHKVNFTDQSSNLYLQDVKNYVYVKFDSMGNFRGMLGHKGRGPGEYVRPSYTATDNAGNIFIFDISRFVTIEYDSAGRFINEFSYPTGVAGPGELFIGDSVRVISLYDFKGSDYFENVNLFHLLDKNFHIIKSINIDYPAIYKKFRLNNFLTTHFVVFRRRLLVNFMALPYIYEYDFAGRLLRRFGRKPDNFHIVNQPVAPDRDILKLAKFLSQFTGSYSFFPFKKKYLFYVYFNDSLPEVGHFKLFELERYRRYYFVIYSVNGERIPADSNQLPGMPLTCDRAGKLYVLLNNEPDHRKIGVYQIEIQPN